MFVLIAICSTMTLHNFQNPSSRRNQRLTAHQRLKVQHFLGRGMIWKIRALKVRTTRLAKHSGRAQLANESKQRREAMMEAISRSNRTSQVAVDLAGVVPTRWPVRSNQWPRPNDSDRMRTEWGAVIGRNARSAITSGWLMLEQAVVATKVAETNRSGKMHIWSKPETQG